MTQGFHVNSANCYGCKSCQVACANEHLLTPGVFTRRVRQFYKSSPVGHAFVSMSCNHCDEPACVENCPVGAYEKRENGLVIQDHSKCIGCQTCVQACPFHAPCYDEATSQTFKCDGCKDRVAAGMMPVCTIVCPSANIAMGEMDSLPEGTDIKDQAATKPNLRVVLDKDIDASVFADIDGDKDLVDPGMEKA